jgi:glycosyltransferase involved in cell wall biosynthesis
VSSNLGDPAAISVVIRAFNSAKTLDQVISRLGPSSQDEVLVIDSGSTDSTVDIAKNLGARLVPFTETFNYSRALNLGFESSNNAWVLVLSSHCIPMEPEHLPRMRRVLAGFPSTTALAYFPTLLAPLPAPPQETTRLFTQREWEKDRMLLGATRMRFTEWIVGGSTGLMKL